MNLTGEDKAQYVKSTFNSVAEKYDFMNTLMSMGMDKRWRKKAVQTVKAKPGMKILDVCCGTGKLTMELSQAVTPSGIVVGLDFSEKMLNVARENISSFPGKDNIKLIQGDAMNLPFEDNTFEGATIGWGLRNVPDLRQALREMLRVVKPGSLIVSLDMGKPNVPVFKQLYWLYFKKFVPFMGKVWAGKQKEYCYLYNSACEFESQTELARVFKQCGLTGTGYINLFGGVVAIVYGQKPV